MFKKLLTNLTATPAESLPPMDASLALCALMVRIARADGDYADAEHAAILALMKRTYALTDEAAEALITQAETLESTAPDTVRFTQKIKAEVPFEARSAVMESLWAVALADGERDAAEDSTMRLATRLLGLRDVDSALARQKAESAVHH